MNYVKIAPSRTQCRDRPRVDTFVFELLDSVEMVDNLEPQMFLLIPLGHGVIGQVSSPHKRGLPLAEELDEKVEKLHFPMHFSPRISRRRYPQDPCTHIMLSSNTTMSFILPTVLSKQWLFAA